MKDISTLIPDIYKLIQRKDGWFDEYTARELSNSITSRLQGQLGQVERTPTLRLSKMGPSCPKALWHSIHTPELAEPIPPWAEIKYTYGHILEALLIALAKSSGHKVEGEQDEIILDGVVGHRDCVIDGCVVDVKSCSSIAFKKFKDRSIQQSDSFGYLDQLDGYVVGCVDDSLVTCKDRGYILGVDKTLGKLVLYEHWVRENSIRERIRLYKEIVAQSEGPACTCTTVRDGESGNVKLGVVASYNSFKHCCFPQLRTFLYAEGPKYLTVVKRQPDVPELRRDGSIIPRFT